MIGTGTNVANLTSGLGNATAASQIGQANAYSNAINNTTNLAALYGLSGNNAAGIGGGNAAGIGGGNAAAPVGGGGGFSDSNVRVA